MSTPMRKQYLQIKKQYPDAILFFRLGDFYETFDEDAKIVAEVCDVALTSRPVSKGQRVPLAGVPWHAAEGYIAKLIRAGYKVAVCEQVGEVGKGLVEREVVRVITPGTLLEPALLDERRNNYIAALIFEGGKRAGIAYADVTTGEFAVTEIRGEEVARRAREELARLAPAELLIPDVGGYPGLEEYRITPYEPWRFETEAARQELLDYYGVTSLEGFGCEGKPLAISAAGALIAYLRETQKRALGHLQPLHTYSTEAYMLLDPATRRSLELVETMREGARRGSLLWVLDRTLTPMGGRLLRKWINQPLLDIEAINRRLDAVEAWVNAPLERAELREALRPVRDIERWANRCTQGMATPRDLVGLRESLRALPQVRAIAARVGQDAGLDLNEEALHLLETAIADDPPATLAHGGVIRSGFNAELDSIALAAKDARAYIAGLETKERQRTGIQKLKVGYNKVFGYYIEVPKSQTDNVPSDYIRKQTLVNAERYITPELKEYESLILNAQERLLDLENSIYKQVVQQLAEMASRLLAAADVVAHLDVAAALAEVAVDRRYVRPELTEDQVLDIRAGRHPVVELTLEGTTFTPNDTHLAPDRAIVILTGPNMAGKSTFLRQTAIITLMAQIGSFVPADAARIGLVDRIFTRIGAQDEIHSGQSTFMVEMIETANILNHATDRSLLILDELGRGTSTYDGMAIAWAVLEYIHSHPKLGSRTLFATHYHELTALADRLPKIVNFHVAVAEHGDQVVFLHEVRPGRADKSYGIHVAQLAGLPKQVIARANEIMRELEEAGREREALDVGEGAMQLSLFSEGPDPIREEIEKVDINTMTPLEALNFLYALQQKAKRL
ncbi:MAG TPA: DNA mismatch repair protein MutS [Anaerolineae bacterium]|nr:DNA mismatch repair protein MutS [Anaerolineae bacterium]